MGTTTTETSGELAGPAAAGLGVRVLSAGVTADLMAVTDDGQAVLLVRCDGEPTGWLRVPPAGSGRNTEARRLDMTSADRYGEGVWRETAEAAAAELLAAVASDMERRGLELLARRASGMDAPEDTEHGLDRLDRAARLRDRAAALDRG